MSYALPERKEAANYQWSVTDGREEGKDSVDHSKVSMAAATEGIKFDQNKPRMELVDPYAIEQLALVLTFGAKKYADNNWRKGIATTRVIAAALRHLFLLLKGEDLDQETGLSHAAHAMCCCMFLLWTIKNKPQFDDRDEGTK